jgi:hypothetical protein
VALLPLPTNARNLHRLRRLFRHDIYRRCYPNALGTEAYLERLAPLLAANPRWFDEEVAKLAAELAKTQHYVYASRDKRYEFDAIPSLPAEADDGPGTVLRGDAASATSGEPTVGGLDAEADRVAQERRR